MTTIDKLDIAIHIQYARRTQFIEQVSDEFRLKEADQVSAQLQIVDFYPRMSELDLLLGVVPRHAPWAVFYPPDTFNSQRRSPFAFHRVAPSLGSIDKQQADMAKLASVKTSTPEEKGEKETLTSCFETIEEINDLIGFVVGRVGQFLQG